MTYPRTQTSALYPPGGFGAPKDWDDAAANIVTWGGAIAGRVVVSTIDPVHHPSVPAAAVFLKAALSSPQWSPWQTENSRSTVNFRRGRIESTAQ